jgi:hypothetical protein
MPKSQVKLPFEKKEFVKAKQAKDESSSADSSDSEAKPVVKKAKVGEKRKASTDLKSKDKPA